MQFRVAHAAVAACLMWGSTAAPGADADPLTLADALSRARSLNPQLAGFVFETRVQEARNRQARMTPAPEIELLLEDAAGSGQRRSLDAAQTTLSLGRIFELGGKQAGRIEMAQAQQARLRTDQAARQLDVAADVARRFVHALAQQERVTAAREAVAVAERVQTAVEERVRAAG
jgi:outer membrane protein, heavy metal efflux system